MQPFKVAELHGHLCQGVSDVADVVGKVGWWLDVDGDSSIDVLGLSGAGDNHDCQSAVGTALEHIDIATTVP